STIDMEVSDDSVINIECSVTDEAGNQTTRLATLTIENIVPVVNITPLSTSAVAGASVVLTANVSNGNAPYTYEWQGDCSGSVSTVSVTSATATTLNCSVKVTDVDGDEV